MEAQNLLPIVTRRTTEELHAIPCWRSGGHSWNALHSLISQAVERLPGRSEERRLNAATGMVTVPVEY